MYTGPGPVKDVFSTTNRMTVLFITDKLLAKGGFKANFTTGYYLGIPGMCTWDYMLHYNFWSKTIKACSISKPKYDFSVCIRIHSFFVILSEIFFLPLHLHNRCLSQFKAGIHIIFSRFTCSSMGCKVVNFVHLRGPFSMLKSGLLGTMKKEDDLSSSLCQKHFQRTAGSQANELFGFQQHPIKKLTSLTF